MNKRMNLEEIRIFNLRRIIATRFSKKQGRFADAVGRPRPNISRLLTKTAAERRSVTEKVARDMERRLNLLGGCLDEPPVSDDEIDGVLEALAATGFEARRCAVGDCKEFPLGPLNIQPRLVATMGSVTVYGTFFAETFATVEELTAAEALYPDLAFLPREPRFAAVNMLSAQYATKHGAGPIAEHDEAYTARLRALLDKEVAAGMRIGEDEITLVVRRDDAILLSDLAMLLPEDEARFRAQIHEEAEKARRIRERTLRERYAPGATEGGMAPARTKLEAALSAAPDSLATTEEIVKKKAHAK